MNNTGDITQSYGFLRVLEIGQYPQVPAIGPLVPARYPQSAGAGCSASRNRNASVRFCGYWKRVAGTSLPLLLASTRIFDLTKDQVRDLLRVLAGTCGYLIALNALRDERTRSSSAPFHMGPGNRVLVPASTRKIAKVTQRVTATEPTRVVT